MSGLLGNLSHGVLLDMRLAEKDREKQKELAPYEHAAFVREQLQSNPMNILGLLGAIPAYQAYKLTGLAGNEATPASMAQLLGALREIGRLGK
jgi:hypothetical protein